MARMNQIIDGILAKRAETPKPRSVIVGISGIDGSGKGYVAGQVHAHLGWRGIASTIINVDGWLNLPDKRFSDTSPAKHFYNNAIRFEEFFSDLIMPLRDGRSIHLVADFTEEAATQYRKHVYDFKDVGVVLVEGIFLFKRDNLSLFDLRIWVECSFPTALVRAIRRAQEGLSTEQTIAAYETIYFPAQRIHLVRDNPRGNADLVFENDLYGPKLFNVFPNQQTRSQAVRN